MQEQRKQTSSHPQRGQWTHRTRHEHLELLVVGTLVACLSLAGCADEESYTSLLNFEISGERYNWRSNEGECQLRNLSMSLTCTIDIGINEDEADATISLNLQEELEEIAYYGTQDTAYPDVQFDFWVPLGSGMRHVSSNDSIRDEQTLHITTLGNDLVEGEFDGYVEDDSGENLENITGRFELVLVE